MASFDLSYHPLFRAPMRLERAIKKPSEYGELVPYPFALDGPRRFLRAPSEEKVAGQGHWPEGLAYRSIRIFSFID